MRRPFFWFFTIALLLVTGISFAKKSKPKTDVRKMIASPKKTAKADTKKAKESSIPPRTRAIPPATKKETGFQLYQRLSKLSKNKDGKQSPLFAKLHKAGQKMDWKKSKQETFVGHLRILKMAQKGKTPHQKGVYLLRKRNGELLLLTLPKELKKGSKSAYANIDKATKYKMNYAVQVAQQTVGGMTYSFAKLSQKPKRALLDRMFFIFVVLMLFLVMVGMGLTLGVNDFAMVIKNPKAMIVGPICQFGLLPLLAFGIGHLFGFASAYPFIFVGLLLVASSPGGVTSNLMTYFAGGDVALSVSLTAFSTILSLFFTPLLLGIYASHIPNLTVPVGAVIVQIMVLVIVPLIVGMLIKYRAPSFALKSEKFFSLLGVFALLFLIIVGVLGNLDKFSDTSRYGVAFYAAIFCLTFSGMFLGAVISKLIGISNYQTRTIALETGLQNASLAMTFALLLQDRMGDFYSSMFFTSGIFGLWMYFAGGIMLFLLRAWFPVTLEGANQSEATA